MLLTGKEIKKKRLEHGMSQLLLAEKLKISNIWLSYIENDKVPATLLRIKIAVFFNNLEKAKGDLRELEEKWAER